MTRTLDNWQSLPVAECILEPQEHRRSIPRHRYGKVGTFPIVDQGQALVGGYTDDASAVYAADLPLILFGDHTRVVKFLDFPFASGADGTKLFRANETRLDPRFLYFAIRNLDIPSRGYNRHFSVLKEISITFPRDKDQQREIAEVLVTLQVACEVEGRIVAAHTELRAATLAKLFGEGLPGGQEGTQLRWPIGVIGEVFDVGNGSTPSRKKEAYWAGGTVPWITSTKVHDTFIRQASEFVTELAREECHLPLVPKGSLVVAITGQGKTLGNSARVDIDTCVNQHLAYLRPKADDVAIDFVLAYLQTQYRTLRAAAAAGGATKGALTCGFLASYTLPRPPVEEQRAIADIWSRLTDAIRAAENRHRTLVSLFQSALEGLLSGSLRGLPQVNG